MAAARGKSKGKSMNRTELVKVYLTPDQKRNLDQLSREEGVRLERRISVSTFVEGLIARELARKRGG